MITISSDRLLAISRAVIGAVGTPPEFANDVAESLVEGNLCGHDSHGVMRLPQYARMAKDGKVLAGARATVDTPRRPGLAMRRVDGHWGWGQPAARLATRTAIALAADTGVAAVAIDHCNHVGRLGEYAAMIADAGMLGFATCNAGPAVAPFGGRARVFGTNPVTFAVPRLNGKRPVLVDFATAGVAEGKVRVALAKGAQVPPGNIVDVNGAPSVEPKAFYDGGSLVAFGLHKGSGLSVMAELLGGGLSGLGPSCLPGFASGFLAGNGTVIMAFNIEDFTPRDQYLERVEAFCAKVGSSQPAQGVSEVLLPGDPEWRSREARLKAGVPLPDATWAEIEACAAELGIPV